MKSVLTKALVLGVVLVGVMLAVNCVTAAELPELASLTQDWLSAGVPSDVVDNLLSGPGDTLGQRAQDALNNGSITQKQYDTVYNSFMALPPERRALLKNAYSKGYADKVENLLTDAAHRKFNPTDDASIRDHIKDLKQQGFTKEQIAHRLKNEGVSTGHLKDLGYGQGEANRVDHAKDLRDSGAEHKVDLAHQKYQNKKIEPSRPGHIKDIQPTERVHSRAQDIRSRRR